jgi:chromosome segregation ATPase
LNIKLRFKDFINRMSNVDSDTTETNNKSKIDDSEQFANNEFDENTRLDDSEQFANNEFDENTRLDDSKASYEEHTYSLDQMMFADIEADKFSYDLIVAVKNIINEKKGIDNKIENTEIKLTDAKEKIKSLKLAIQKKERETNDYKSVINDFEEKIMKMQMSYDQLLEDYQNYQEEAKTEFENVKFLYQKEQEKYAILTADSKEQQMELHNTIEKLEERIRDLEAENKNITDKYNETLTEKNDLLQIINDFTGRFAGNSSKKVTIKDKFTGNGEPPQIVVDNVSMESEEN